ncbi:hypothetical protein FACS189459_1470 [Bacilli bacterium]|nr:hypothetical protein FACS189459_1470 [Bacilli bacterium]
MSTMDENGKLHDHDSFPDFILKDSRGRIHIFEVKSFNQSNSFFFDENEYKEKIKSLQECYL